MPQRCRRPHDYEPTIVHVDSENQPVSEHFATRHPTRDNPGPVCFEDVVAGELTGN